jgi:hypothetical protein
MPRTRYAPRLAATAMLLPIALLAGCAATVVQSGASRCSGLLPTEWDKGVAAADLPASAKLSDGHDDARPWQAGFVGQTGQLEIANSRYVDGLGIIRRCEDRDAAAVKAAGRKRFGLF